MMLNMLDKSLRPTLRLTLAAIEQHAKDDVCLLTNKQLAEIAALPLPTVIDCLKELREMGRIESILDDRHARTIFVKKAQGNE